MEDPASKKTVSVKGIVGIFEMMDNFLTSSITVLEKGDIQEKRDLIQDLEAQFKAAREYVRKGRVLVFEISELLTNTDKLITSISFIDLGFKVARKGLRGVSDLSEQAVSGIQASSDSIQTSIDEVTKDLESFQKSGCLTSAEKESINSIIAEIKKVADVTFNIMMDLQFQDILRQQLSAVADILSKTRERISKGIEKATGITIEVSEVEEGFAVTDESVLNRVVEQSDIDEFIKQAKKE